MTFVQTWDGRLVPTNATSTPTVASVKLSRQVAYQGNTVDVTATTADGALHTGPLEAVLTEKRTDAQVRRPIVAGTFSTADVPAGRYRVTVDGVMAGPLAVL